MNPNTRSPIAASICLAILLASPGAQAEVEAGPAPKDPNRYELGLLPAINFDSNTGFGFGVITNLAKFQEGVDPYGWRLTAQIYASVKGGPSGAEFPLQSHYISVDVPQFINRALRLRFDASFRRQVNTGYFGLGNASKNDVDLELIDKDAEPAAYERAFRFNQYDRIYPELRASLQVGLLDEISAFGGVGVVWNFVNLYEGSQALLDRAQLVGVDRHGVFDAQLGLLYDSRDDEIAAEHGMFHEVSFRAGTLVELEHAYGGANATGRFYQSLVGSYLVLAARAMVDLQFGDPPFYELARHGGLFADAAIAGDKALRGPPGERWHGKIKLLTNLELRSKFVYFSMFGLESNLGAVVFFDSGRVFADFKDQPHLDGTGLGLKFGTGGGVRIQWGQTFIIRGDFGWSPDGIATFINVDHIF